MRLSGVKVQGLGRHGGCRERSLFLAWYGSTVLWSLKSTFPPGHTLDHISQPSLQLSKDIWLSRGQKNVMGITHTISKNVPHDPPLLPLFHLMAQSRGFCSRALGKGLTNFIKGQDSKYFRLWWPRTKIKDIMHAFLKLFKI